MANHIGYKQLGGVLMGSLEASGCMRLYDDMGKSRMEEDLEGSHFRTKASIHAPFPHTGELI